MLNVELPAALEKRLEISRLQRSDQRRIVDFLENRLASRDNPRELGEALTGPLAGLWKYRVGSFRVLTRIDDSAVAIWVVQVGDRREVYR
ncbi:type II toxin-antitoxin system RelE/ParE family toxin [Mesorhizobium sp. M0018]|uniref:type II toxin-antitoxin system RelE family toxin n=1 Tax=Mesorhizobium sp. M0018 TaxID=2956844 RepID=UPI003338A5CA